MLISKLLKIQVEGQRSPKEIFEDLAEEISGILQRPINASAEEETPHSGDPAAENPRLSVESKQTEVVVHSSSEIGRRESIDSVDAMIEEEMLNTVPSPEPVKETILTGTSSVTSTN